MTCRLQRCIRFSRVTVPRAVPSDQGLARIRLSASSHPPLRSKTFPYPTCSLILGFEEADEQSVGSSLNTEAHCEKAWLTALPADGCVES